MNHEVYVNLRLALDRLSRVEVKVEDMPFLACQVQTVRTAIENALKAGAVVAAKS